AADLYRSLWTFFPDELDHGLNLAETLSTAGRNAEARAVIDELRRLPEPEGQDPRIDLKEAEIAMRMADYAAQLKAAERAIEKGEELAEIQVMAEGLTYKGDALLLSGNPRESIVHYQRARTMFGQAGNKPAEAKLLLSLGVSLQQMSNLAEARDMIESALDAAEKQGSSRSISLLQANLAVLHMDLGDVRGARELIEPAYAAFKAEGDRVREEKALYVLSTALLAQGDVAGSRQRLQMVRNLAQQTGNRTDLVVTLDDLGVLLARQNSPAQAMRLHNQALAISRSLGDQGRIARVLISMGDTLTQMGALTRARQCYAEAFEHARAMGHRLLVARASGGLSRLSYVQGDLATARRHAESELRIALDAGAQPIAIRARADLAQLYLAGGELDTARRYLDEALDTANSLGLELEKMTLHLRLARVALAEGDTQAAAALARETADWFGKRQLVADQARSLAVLAEALLTSKRLAEAQEVASQLRALAGNSDDLELRITAAVQAARIGSTAGEVGESFMKMRQAEEMARNTGLVAAGLEARLVLGQFQLERLDRVAGREALEGLRREAEAKGFWRVAGHAAEALQVNRSPRSPAPPGAPVAGR
ncbi:MAG TPA: tetratricopeptide repeat protein, partial [Thermoanaerobaculia bacterium]|nr:tetratricopeptide repeat protein [Thermoanaerobaculia bacterium]